MYPTGRYYFTDPCPHCNGTGRVRPQKQDGWRVDYHYQDGHELCGPYDKATAVEHAFGERDGTCSTTLIGPDGQIYSTQNPKDPERAEYERLRLKFGN